jgi:hypothetical protein
VSWFERYDLEILVALVIAAVLASAVFGVWDHVTCAERGPPRQEMQYVSCGDNCHMWMPVTVSDCVRRKP